LIYDFGIAIKHTLLRLDFPASAKQLNRKSSIRNGEVFYEMNGIRKKSQKLTLVCRVVTLQAVQGIFEELRETASQLHPAESKSQTILRSVRA
jgi:hypothetical protein